MTVIKTWNSNTSQWDVIPSVKGAQGLSGNPGCIASTSAPNPTNVKIWMNTSETQFPLSASMIGAAPISSLTDLQTQVNTNQLQLINGTKYCTISSTVAGIPTVSSYNGTSLVAIGEIYTKNKYSFGAMYNTTSNINFSGSSSVDILPVTSLEAPWELTLFNCVAQLVTINGYAGYAFKPTIAGTYKVTIITSFICTVSQNNWTGIYKNTTRSALSRTYTSSGQATCLTASAIFSCNGTTDYFSAGVTSGVSATSFNYFASCEKIN